ncbi:MAG: hypothetical protein FWC00_06425 [Firmicutes bacterium]|nr:hypothetical protein [Bacillota bacterium]
MGEKLVDNTREKPRFWVRNVNIILVNIFAAAMLLFCICFFFFSNVALFRSDITSYMAFSPIIFLLGVGFICFYIIAMVISIESNATQFADRYNLAYKIVFSIVLFMLIIRSFLGDFNNSLIDPETGYAIGTNLNVHIGLIIAAIISGLITWLTPKIRDNDNTEF